jgi:2-polyprenyl-3-methyl-5-hydroxy-6-metoxy-1,4-benzoquinol methylase
MDGTHYKVYGYKGKQVRDNIHSYDVIRAMEEVIKNPIPGSVYNLGGGRENSISMLEAIAMIEEISGKRLSWEYVNENRVGDHICYISDLRKFQKDYPNWKITKSVRRTIIEIIGASFGGVTTERYLPGDGGDDYFENYASEIEKRCFGNVLDIGCGHGFLTARISENPNVISVIGTDIDDGYKEQGSKIYYDVIDTAQLIKMSNSVRGYDSIVSTEHIEHLPENLQMDLIEWISKNLSDSGLFLGSMPHPDDPNNPNVYHIKTYTHGEWEVILNKYFTDVEVYTFDNDSYWWSAKKQK